MGNVPKETLSLRPENLEDNTERKWNKNVRENTTQTLPTSEDITICIDEEDEYLMVTYKGWITGD